MSFVASRSTSQMSSGNLNGSITNIYIKGRDSAGSTFMSLKENSDKGYVNGFWGAFCPAVGQNRENNIQANMFIKALKTYTPP